MRLKNIPGSRESIAGSPFVVQAPELCRGRWREAFKTPGPLYAEIGMGKGKFLMEMARRYPDINFIGIEKYSSVLLRAVQKMEEDPLPNVRLVRMEAEDLESVFSPGELTRIYLNFSDPWPKDRHAKRRLPSAAFLARYARVLCPEGEVEFKTDNRDLFAFALGELEGSGFQIRELTYDLHRDERLCRDNVTTEYEERFSAAGRPICKYILSRREESKEGNHVSALFPDMGDL